MYLLGKHKRPFRCSEGGDQRPKSLPGQLLTKHKTRAGLRRDLKSSSLGKPGCGAQRGRSGPSPNPYDSKLPHSGSAGSADPCGGQSPPPPALGRGTRASAASYAAPSFSMTAPELQGSENGAYGREKGDPVGYPNTKPSFLAPLPGPGEEGEAGPGGELAPHRRLPRALPITQGTPQRAGRDVAGRSHALFFLFSIGVELIPPTAGLPAPGHSHVPRPAPWAKSLGT